MSYILDALKKSDQERQQGTSPHLYSMHGSTPTAIDTSPLIKRPAFWLILGGCLLLITCLGILFLLYQQHQTAKGTIKAVDTSLPPAASQVARTTLPDQPADQVVVETITDTSSPRVLLTEKNSVLSSTTVQELPADPPVVIEQETSQNYLPLLQDLSSELRAEIPKLNFAGHTYSENPSQRMIIINGMILREGDMIAPYTHLTEITWEGVTIGFKGTRFRVKTD